MQFPVMVGLFAGTESEIISGAQNCTYGIKVLSIVNVRSERLPIRNLIIGQCNLVVFSKVKFQGLAGFIKRLRPQVVAWYACNNCKRFSIYLINAQCGLASRTLFGSIHDSLAD